MVIVPIIKHIDILKIAQIYVMTSTSREVTNTKSKKNISFVVFFCFDELYNTFVNAHIMPIIDRMRKWILHKR